MANKHKGEVIINIGGMEKKLKFDMNTLAEVEGILDRPIHQVLNENKLGIREIRALLYAGIQWDGKPLSLKQIGEMLNFDNMQYFAEKIGEALRYFTGEKKETEVTDEGKK